jgi:hypothetical protein
MSYTCYHCKEKKMGKPWVIYDDNPNKNICMCGYLCNVRSNILETHYDRVINREDFNYLCPILPVKKEKKKFIPKSEFEQSLMTDDEYQKYISEYNEYFAYRPQEHQIYLENKESETRTEYIENEYNSESELNDDY